MEAKGFNSGSKRICYCHLSLHMLGEVSLEPLESETYVELSQLGPKKGL